ncbi:hypothetical protein YC2023_019922 [Brassica napus]
MNQKESSILFLSKRHAQKRIKERPKKPDRRWLWKPTPSAGSTIHGGLNRSGKSCRLRWVNYLRPGLKRGQITPQEEGIILELHSLWGNKWSTIARYLPGRTDNEIKNYWRTHYKKKDKSFSKQDKYKRSRKQLGMQPQPQNQRSQMVSQNHMNHDNEQNIASSFSYPTSVIHDQFHMPQSVTATSSDHSMIDEGNLWGSLWSLNDEDRPHRFGGGWEQRTAADISEKFNGDRIEAPPCGSGEYNYNGFYTGGMSGWVSLLNRIFVCD